MVLYIVYNNIIWACIIAAVIGAGAATLVFHLKGGKKGEAKEFSAKNALVAGLHANALRVKRQGRQKERRFRYVGKCRCRFGRRRFH